MKNPYVEVTVETEGAVLINLKGKLNNVLKQLEELYGKQS